MLPSKKKEQTPDEKPEQKWFVLRACFEKIKLNHAQMCSELSLFKYVNMINCNRK